MSSKYIVHINSRDRLSGTNSDFIYEVPFPSGSSFNRVCVLQAAIPKSYYNVPSTRRSFVLTEDASSATITLSAGNYSRSTLATALATALNAGSPNLYTYTVSYSSINAVDTGKYTFTCSGGVGHTIKFTFTNALWEQLGFDRDSVNTFTGTALVATNVMNMARENTIRIHSDIFQGTIDDILVMIYSGDSSTFSYITYECLDVEMNSQVFVGTNSSKYRFFITTEDNEPLDTNGINMNFSLVFFNDNESIMTNHNNRIVDILKMQSALLSN